MFDQFKEKIQAVQQDLNAGLKTLSEKARDVGRSKKLPGELHVLENKQGILSALKPDCVDAGDEILNRFQQLWTQLHINIEYSADKATKADKVIQTMADEHDKQILALRQLHTQVKEVPSMVTHIQTLAVTLGKLEANFEEIESMLDSLQDTCEEEELLNNKKMQIAELLKYKDQKAKERELRRVRLLDEYNQKFRRVEEIEDAKKKERQKTFQDVFVADMDHYRTHGKMSRLVSQSSQDLESTLDDFELMVNKDEQRALDDFLGPGEDGGPDNQLASMDPREEEEEGDTEKTEVMATETEDEVMVDVTKIAPGTEDSEDGEMVKQHVSMAAREDKETVEEERVDVTETASELAGEVSDIILTSSTSADDEHDKIEGKNEGEDDADEGDDSDDAFGTPDEDAESQIGGNPQT